MKGKIDFPVGIIQDYKEGKFGGHHTFFDGDDVKSALKWLNRKDWLINQEILKLTSGLEINEKIIDLLGERQINKLKAFYDVTNPSDESKQEE